MREERFWILSLYSWFNTESLAPHSFPFESRRANDETTATAQHVNNSAAESYRRIPQHCYYIVILLCVRERLIITYVYRARYYRCIYHCDKLRTKAMKFRIVSSRISFYYDKFILIYVSRMCRKKFAKKVFHLSRLKLPILTGGNPSRNRFCLTEGVRDSRNVDSDDEVVAGKK